jgi:hypothetical protein
MLALPISEPDVERVGSQEKPNVERELAIVILSSLCGIPEIVQQTLCNDFLREAMPWTTNQTKQ